MMGTVGEVGTEWACMCACGYLRRVGLTIARYEGVYQFQGSAAISIRMRESATKGNENHAQKDGEAVLPQIALVLFFGNSVPDDGFCSRQQFGLLAKRRRQS